MRHDSMHTLVPIALMLLLCSGCGQRAVQQPTASGLAQETAVPLPEWAPKDPSPEFLRAARVLKPMPDEFWAGREQDDLSRRALSARYGQTLSAAWEFFGTLSDEQINRLQATKEIRVPFTSLTKEQRTALLRYFDVWRDAFRGVSPTDEEYGEDWLVGLYKFGAREDLSNVEIRFLVRASGIVAMMLQVRQPDGSVSPPLPAGLGQMAADQGGNEHAE